MDHELEAMTPEELLDFLDAELEAADFFTEEEKHIERMVQAALRLQLKALHIRSRADVGMRIAITPYMTGRQPPCPMGCVLIDHYPLLIWFN